MNTDSGLLVQKAEDFDMLSLPAPPEKEPECIAVIKQILHHFFDKT